MTTDTTHVWRFFIALFVFHAVTSDPLAAETKEFLAYQCRYTLPDNDWSWVDPSTVPNVLCVARSSDELVFMITVVPLPASMCEVVPADKNVCPTLTRAPMRLVP